METILVAEDSRTQAEALRLILEGEGFTVDTVADGRQAFERVCRHRPDVIISDVAMPELTGYELCRQLKAGTATSDIPFVLVTAFADPAELIQILECGADSLVTKPYDPIGLVTRIRNVLQSRWLRAGGRGEETVAFGPGGQTLTCDADRKRLLDLLVASFEEAVRANQALHARELDLTEVRVREDI